MPPYWTVRFAANSPQPNLALFARVVETRVPRATSLEELSRPRRRLEKKSRSTIAEILTNRRGGASAEEHNPIFIALAAKHAEHARIAERDVLDAKRDELTDSHTGCVEN